MRVRVTVTIACLVLLTVLAANCTDLSALPAPATLGPIVEPKPDPNPVRTTAQLTTQEHSLLTSSNKFGLNLFRHIVATAPSTENVFISPLSASYALGLCYSGADGETREAIGATLQLAGLSVEEVNQAYHDLTAILVAADPVVDFRVGNSLWSRQGKAIQPGFVDLAKTWFDARVEEIDFLAPWAADTINAWVSRATNDKITEMVAPPISGNLAALLCNAVYFKGMWVYPFDTAITRDTLFYLADGTTTRCRMMRISELDCILPDSSHQLGRHDMRPDAKITWYDDPDVFVLSMPFGRGDYRMSIVIPNRFSGYPQIDSTKSIDGVIADMTYLAWRRWSSGATAWQFDLGLPRFRFDCNIGLTEVLKSLGMDVAFDPKRADFSNLFADGVGWIGGVKQKTFIQVDETGTEVATVTPTVFADSVPPEMICDRPFLIVIHEDVSGAILFMGRIANPIWED